MEGGPQFNAIADWLACPREEREAAQVTAFSPQCLSEIAMHKDGSHWLQKLVSGNHAVALSFEEQEILVSSLMQVSMFCHKYANYIVQKLFLTLNAEQKQAVSNMVWGQCNMLATDSCGERVLQTMFETVFSDEDRVKCCEELKPNLVELVSSDCGNHIVQKIIKVTPQHASFVFDVFLPPAGTLDINAITAHQYGTRIIQNMLRGCKSHERYDDMITEIVNNAKTLAMDHNGNYAVQTAIEECPPETVANKFLPALWDSLKDFACHKFGSHVIEKLAKYGGAEVCNKIIDYFLEAEEGAKPFFLDMMVDDFGNYPAQGLVNLMDEAHVQKCVELVKPRFEELVATPPGQRSVLALKKKAPQDLPFVPHISSNGGTRGKGKGKGGFKGGEKGWKGDMGFKGFKGDKGGKFKGGTKGFGKGPKGIPQQQQQQQQQQLLQQLQAGINPQSLAVAQLLMAAAQAQQGNQGQGFQGQSQVQGQGQGFQGKGFQGQGFQGFQQNQNAQQGFQQAPQGFNQGQNQGYQSQGQGGYQQNQQRFNPY